MDANKKNKNMAWIFGIIAGLLAITIGTAAYWYKKQLTDGNLIKKPDPTKPGTATGVGAAAASGSGTGIGLASITRNSITIPAGSRVKPGTLVSTPDGNAIDLYSVAQAN